MRRERSALRALAVIVACAGAGLGCAPDLTIGSAAGGGGSSTTSGGGGGTTSSGGATSSGGTTSSGGSEAGLERWADMYLVDGDNVPMSIAIDVEQNVAWIAGQNTGTFGTRTVMAYRLYLGAEGDWYFDSLDPTYGGPDGAAAIARSEDSYFIAGDLQGPTDDPVEPGAPQSKGGSDCLAGKLEGSDLWFRSIGTEGFSTCAGVAVTPGGVFVAGTFSGVLDAEVKGGGQELVSTGGYDMFVAQLTQEGAPIDAWKLGDDHDQRVRALQSDAAGNLYVLGSDESGNSLNYGDIVLDKLSPDGEVLEPRRYGTAHDERPMQLAVSADGWTAIAGSMVEPIDVGGGALGGEGFVAVFDAEGKHVWSHGIEDVNGYFSVRALLFDDAHRLFVGGDFSYSMSMAGAQVGAKGGFDAFHAGFDANGGLLWLRSFGGSQEESIAAFALAGDGTLIATGHFVGTVKVAGIELYSLDSLEPFIVGISP